MVIISTVSKFSPLSANRVYSLQSRGLRIPLTEKTKGEKVDVSKREKIRFSKLVIPGGNTEKLPRRQYKLFKPRRCYNFTMWDTMKWVKHWPTPSSFSTATPLPMRQGYTKGLVENQGIIPDAVGNTELMKIPNFLHLTPKHIKQHCAAIKPFCTKWPSGLTSDEVLRRHYPVEVVSRDILMSSPSIRDKRARKVTISVPLNRLGVEGRSLEKMRLLAGKDRFEMRDGIEYLVLTSERCPVRQQNYDFLMYVLSALTSESKKLHAWEAEKTEEDGLQFEWDGSKSQANLTELLQRMKISDQAVDDPEAMLDDPDVKEYGRAVANLVNEGEDGEQLEEYRRSVEQLLGLKASES